MNLEEVAPIIEQIIKETLAEKRYPFGFGRYKGISNKVASGKLINSVQVKVGTDRSSKAILQVMMEEYGRYVQSGRLPGKKMVPITPLIQWIKARKLKGRNKFGRFITNESFAFAIATNIKKYGIRPANFVDISIEKIFEDPRIAELIGEATYDDLINAIEGL